MSGHTANEMEKIILDTLLELNIDLKNCRGQSYDNANNMSGRYAGLKAKIKEHNPLGSFIYTLFNPLIKFSW